MAKEKRAAWFRVCLHQKALMDAVSDAVLGKAFKAVMVYFETGEETDLDALENAVFQAFKPWVDMATEEYKQSVENGRKGARQKAQALLANAEPPSASLTHKEEEKEEDKEEDKEKEVREKDKEEDIVCIQADKPPASKRFTPPTLEAATAYCKEKGYTMDVTRFLDYYTAVGWRIGKSPMKDWKAAIRNWYRKEQTLGKTNLQPTWTVGIQI